MPGAFVRQAVEESIIALSANVISSAEDKRPSDAAEFSGALRDACAALESLMAAEEDE